MDSPFVIFQNFSRQKVFLGKLLAKKIQVSASLGGKGYNFAFPFYRKAKNANAFALIDTRPFSQAACS